MNNNSKDRMQLANKSLLEKTKKKRSEPTDTSKTKNKNNGIYYKKTKANDMLINIGRKIIDDMSEKEQANLCSHSDDLYFICLLGTASKKKKRKVGSKKDGSIETIDISTPIGVKLMSKIEIEVPHLKDVKKNNKTGINPGEDFEYKKVKAHEPFDLTLYEFMFLIIQPEYSGKLRVYNKDYYAYLSVKVHKFEAINKVASDCINKLPTPTIIFEKGNGSTKENMNDVDQLNDIGEWVPRKGYERFSPFLNNRKTVRKDNQAPVRSSSHNTSIMTSNGISEYSNYLLFLLALQEKLSLSDRDSSHKGWTKEDLINRGKEIINSMDINRRATIGSKASTLKVVNKLAIEKFTGRLSYLKVGFTLYSDEAIQVPIINVLKNHKTGISATTDISYQNVAAGEKFYVSNYEFMYLLLQDEYGGSCIYGDRKVPFSLPLEVEKYLKGEEKLPKIKLSQINKLLNDTVHINDPATGTIKKQYIKFLPLCEEYK